MKTKLFLFALMIGLFSGSAFASDALQFGFNMGGLAPDSDNRVKEDFGQNFTVNGTASWVMNGGLELRGLLGMYSDTSHKPSKAGKNFRFEMSELQVSALYNISQSNRIRPYAGIGAGAVFYSLKDDEFGDLENGTKFGWHVVLGTKLMFTDSVYTSIEYEKQFLPGIFFNDSTNFNTSSLTLGIGIILPSPGGSSPYQSQSPYQNQSAYVPAPPVQSVKSVQSVSASNGTYPFSQHEEELLTKIQQKRTELAEMKKRKMDLQAEIDTFYNTQTYNERSATFMRKLQAIKFNENKVTALDRQIESATNNLNGLEATWALEHPQKPQTETQVIYLNTHYYESPWGLHRSNQGYLHYGSRPYSPRYENSQTVNVYQNSTGNVKAKTPSEIQEENSEYLNKKNAHILEMKR